MKNFLCTALVVIMLTTPANSQGICTGNWSPLFGLPIDFEVTEDGKVKFPDNFTVTGSCAFVFTSIPDSDIVDGSFSVDFGNSQVMSGTVTGTFSEDGQTAEGILTYTVHLCGDGPVSIEWQAWADGPCTITNARQYTHEFDILLFPNPAHSHFTVEIKTLPATALDDYTLFNAAGQQVRTGSFSEDRQVIPTTALAQGNYLLEVIKDGHYRVIRQVVIY